MIKKICSLILVVSMILNVFILSVNASSYGDVAEGTYCFDAVEALTTYGIVSGYNGNFRPNETVTRAEFAKITALISGLEDEVYSNAGNKRFDDVPLLHWATGYINTVANNKIIIGYPDGTYQPERKITYAEALTIVLRTLGYSTAELGDNWPYAYMVKAKGLGLCDGLTVPENSPITRGDLAVIVNRALETEMNNSTQKLLANLDITVMEDVFVIATQKEDSTLAEDEIRTTSGVYRLSDNLFRTSVPSQGDLMVNKDGKVINFTETEKLTRTITTVEGVVNNNVFFTNGTSSSSLGISNGTGIYNDGTISTFGAFKPNIKEGSGVSVVFDKFGKVKFLLFGNADYTTAVTVRTNIYDALKTVGITKEMVDSANVIRNGYSATLGDAEIYDVAYYLAENSTIYLYSDKISGIYNEAFPNKVNVAEVEISGNILGIETQTAMHKLGEKSGNYKIGSKITALLGKDGKIADVVDLNSSDRANYAVLLSFSTESAEGILEAGKQEHYVNILNGDGNELKYKVRSINNDLIGAICKISVDSNGYAVFEQVSNNGITGGYIDKFNRKIGDNWLTNDCIIIERTTPPFASAQTGVSARVIDFEDISSNELSSGNVIFALTTGSFKDISLLFLQDASTDRYTYGILKSSDGNIRGTSVSGSYEVFSNGKMASYNTNFYNNIKAGNGVAMTLNNGSLTSIKSLTVVETVREVQLADFSRIKIGSSVYKLADDVQIIRKTTNGYLGMSKNDIEELIGRNVSLFADTAVPNGGLIRIVVVFD